MVTSAKKEAGVKKIQPHDGTVQTKCDFAKVFCFLVTNGKLDLKTSRGKKFTAEATESRERSVVKFRQDGKEYAKAYECCWGHEYNCIRTRIGMYCRALDTKVVKG